MRGGTSFLCPTATKKRSKENAFQQSVLSVPSVQTTAFGSRIERCSLEPRTLETLLLANPYIPTLRHQCSRARTVARGPSWPDASLRVGGLRDPRDHSGKGALRAIRLGASTSEKSRNASRQAQTTAPQIATHRIVHSTSDKGEAVAVRGRIELAREHWWRSVGMSGFARRRASSVRGSSEHRSTREPKAVCTLGTLNTDCGEAFSLLRFFVAVGQRNEVPPRTVANSDKKFS